MQNNGFIESLKVSVSEEDALENFKKNEYEKYARLYENKDVQEYFHYLVAAILMSYHKRYADFTVEVPYRFKSPKSTQAKLEDYYSTISREEKKDGTLRYEMKQIKDIFALKMISYSRPPVTFSSDPEIMGLIKEKAQNLELLKKMQEFKTRLIEDEYVSPRKYKFEVTKYEYYKNCKELIERIISLIHPNAINLLEYYQKLKFDVENCIEFIKAANEENVIIDEDDLNNTKLNFCDLLQDFTLRIYDKLDLAILTKQFKSLFIGNEIFEKMGVYLIPQVNEKRTSDGFVANFIYLSTPFGKIECQMQSKHEYEEGNYGYAAHTKLTGKAVKPLPIPDVKEKEKVKEFIHEIRQIVPKSFVARIDSIAQDRIVTQQLSDYQNYKNLTSQIAKGDPCEKYLLNYFGRLYVIQNQIFKTREQSLGFVESDIETYINSDKLLDIKEKYSKDYIR